MDTTNELIMWESIVMMYIAHVCIQYTCCTFMWNRFRRKRSGSTGEASMPVSICTHNLILHYDFQFLVVVHENHRCLMFIQDCSYDSLTVNPLLSTNQTEACCTGSWYQFWQLLTLTADWLRLAVSLKLLEDTYVRFVWFNFIDSH